MAYFNQENKKSVANAIKPILKKYGIKATLSVKHHSEVCLNIKSGKLDFIGNDEYKKRIYNDSISLNLNARSDGFSGECKEFLDEAIIALRSAGFYDRSDILTDYFDIAYYYSIMIGNYKTPYTLTK